MSEDPDTGHPNALCYGLRGVFLEGLERDGEEFADEGGEVSQVGSEVGGEGLGVWAVVTLGGQVDEV